MARAPDLVLKQELLDEVVAYLGKHGLGAVSLRPMALALGTSLNRLVHHFGSKDELVAAALERAIEVQAVLEAGWVEGDPHIRQTEIHRRWWAWMNASPENLAMVRLGYEAATLDATASGIPGNVRAAQVGTWREFIERRLEVAGVPAEASPLEATMIKATFTGLVTELFATGDRQRLSAVLEEWLSRVDDRLASYALTNTVAIGDR
jgi:AcrR family transcriptional regulator